MRRLAALGLILCLCACENRSAAPVVPPVPPPPPRVAPLPGTALVLLPASATEKDIDLPVPVVAVDVVSTHVDRQRGLGGRATLPDGEGMLFVYPRARARTFWMKDCLVALDIVFLGSDGQIRAISTLPPGVGLSGQEIPSASCDAPVRYVLEVRARWMAEQKIAVGDLVDVSRVVVGVEPE